MTKTEFKKEGWLDHFIQYDQFELATMIMIVQNLLEPTVNYCMYQIELDREESSIPEDQTVH
jgi:hypothetical protein